jgi:hypothetical protein
MDEKLDPEDVVREFTKGGEKDGSGVEFHDRSVAPTTALNKPHVPPACLSIGRTCALRHHRSLGVEM